VLLIEYRGYGNCGGTPSERAIVADSLALIDLAAGRPEIDATRLVYHGRSIGGAIAAQVAARRAPWALILESTFTHAGWFALRYGAPPFLVTSPFRTKSVLPLLTCPILLFHGTADSIIPVAHGRKLAKIQPAATLVEFDGATHNDMPGPGNEREYWTRIGAVLGGT
ncbi:MAG: alpha/beta hydrolase, partial [Planctomycetota bacterium]